MSLRKLTDNDREAFAKLLRYAFGSTENTYDGVVPENLDEDAPWLKNLDECYGIFDEDQLLSAGAYFVSPTTIRGKEFQMGGVWGVTTKPQYRKQGLVGKIMDRMLEDMYKESVPISILYPFKHSFYEKFGYKLADEMHGYQIKLDDIIYREINNRVVREVFSLDDIKTVYNKIAGNIYNYMLKRNDNQWKNRLGGKKPGYLFVCYDEKQDPLGYIALKFVEKDKFDNIEEEERTLYVYEMLWFDRETRQSLFNFLKLHHEHRTYVTFTSPDPDIINYVRNPRMKSNQIMANSMFRIIDIKTVLKTFDYSYDANISIKVNDENCKWNNKTFLFEVNNFKGSISETTSSPDVKIDIGSLGQMVVGYRTASQLYNSWDIECTPEMLNILDRLFPTQTNYIRDFF